jgi:undecaprenyl-diphosphatase
MVKRIWFVIHFCACLLVRQAGFTQAPAIDKSTLIELAEHRSHEPLEFHQFISNSTNWISLGVPAGLLLSGRLRHDKNMQLAGLNIGKSILISTGITVAIKFSVNRNRPFLDYPLEIPKAGAGGSPSFPSGHTSQAFATATALYLEYPKWYIAIPAYGWASVVGYSRMYLGVHYPTDVLAGALVGSGSALLNKQLNRLLHKQHSRTAHTAAF